MFTTSTLYQAPKGVLLFGPPGNFYILYFSWIVVFLSANYSFIGCGKTLIAKATAKEAGMRFINLDVAMLTGDKNNF